MNTNWKIGDIVQLKSGGPAMTVTSVGSDAVGCHWFTGSTPADASFPPDALQLYYKPEPANTGAARVNGN